eukprot:CAMPEP_0184534156 /NCGR_PEP_ID=MMETSP0198_2-20121128/15173_1 /TAXON_ID=1112570 /ORGANISM="Thraustochytrium sp., Strain LLF1b" /LENGTH=294 /DNA_ID=CAMNT_0026927047 /DNA_START=83 /DNA_END=967 /DNA_ORIENTATION=+
MTLDTAAYTKALAACREELRAFIDKMNCHPIMIRFAWHDSGTFDVKRPGVGGADGSIRFDEELGHGANAGLIKARGYIEQFKNKYPILSYADLIQMASAEAVSLAGGPTIAMRYGRKDAESCPAEGNLPGAGAPFAGNVDAAQHLRDVFHRMGFNDKDIVALSGAHTVGRAFAERSGTTPCGYGSKGTGYTSNENHIARPDGHPGLGMLGGQSWTKSWLTFNNDYFKQPADKDLLVLETDNIIRTDPGFKPYFSKYAESQDAFFQDYADAHRRLSELGSTWLVPGGITLPNSKL